MGRDLTEIASLFIGVALVALLVSHSQGTTAIIGATVNGFNGLLQTVELTNNYANPVAN